MDEFNSVMINGESYDVHGYFTIFHPAIVIECKGLVQLFKQLKGKGEVVKSVTFMKCNDKVSSFYENNYVVDVIKNNEVQLYPK